MCDFWSGLIDKKGKVYWKLGIDSHTKLEELFGFEDKIGGKEYAKVEVVPPNGGMKEVLDVGTWSFKLDEAREPEWWNEGYKGLVLNTVQKEVIPKHYRKLRNGGIKVIGWYENGQKRYEWNYKDGQRHGKWILWYMNGQQEYEENYKDGQRHGKRIAWYTNGQQEYECNYKDGQKHGKWMGWYENGQQEYEWNYKDGQKHGKRIIWCKNGQQEYERNYKDGKII